MVWSWRGRRGKRPFCHKTGAWRIPSPRDSVAPGAAISGPAVAIGDAPDGAVAVLGEDQRAVLGDSDADRPAPDIFVGDDEAGGEILILAGRLAILEFQPHHLVA